MIVFPLDKLAFMDMKNEHPLTKGQRVLLGAIIGLAMARWLLF